MTLYFRKNWLFLLIGLIGMTKLGYGYSNVYVVAKNAAYCLDHTGNLKWSFPYPSNAWELSSPAIGEINSDGEAEMVFCTMDKVYCLGINNGTLKWSYSVANWSEARIDLGTPIIANIDTIGDPEIIVPGRDTIYCFNSDGSIKWGYAMSIGYDTYDQSWSGAHAIVANINGDTPDVIALNPKTVYCLKSNGTLRWSFAMTGNDWGGAAVADVDLDGQPEIIVSDPYNGFPDSCTHFIYCLRPDGSLKWKQHGKGTISQVAIADINNDSKPELVAYNSENPMGGILTRKVRAYRVNLAGTGLDTLWTVNITDFTDVSASFPVLCDLTGNGYRDIVIEGCTQWPPKGGMLYIFNGLDGKAPDNSGGAPYTNDTFATQTLNEHAASVADIDEDGHLEVVGQAHDTSGFVYGVAVLGSNSWQGGRNLFTSERYHITDINDNLSVPRIEPNNWQSHNSWDAQSTTGGGVGWGTPYVKWVYTNPSFGEIYTSIAIAPVGGGGTEENNATKKSNLEVLYKNGKSVARFSLAKEANVFFYIFDLSGRQRKTVHLGTMAAGSHEVPLDLTSLVSGIYFVQVQVSGGPAGAQNLTCKTILIR